MNKVILVAGASSGWGHMKAAQNISAALATATDVWDTRVVDIFDYLPFGGERVINSAWRFASQHLSSAYSNVYKRLIKRPADRVFTSAIIDRTAENLQSEHELENVVAFVATHSSAAAVGASLKREHNFKLCVVATDFLLHSLQIHSSVDCFYVPPKFELVASIGQSRLLHNRVVETGIPIAAEFGIKKTQSAARAKLGLSDTLMTALVSFGGDGLLAERHVELFEQLLSSGFPLQFIVLAGRNVRFANAMEKRYRTTVHWDRIKLFKYHEQVNDFYSAADMFIGKGGGLSISEALSSDLPIVFVDMLPGQEEFNVSLMTSLGLSRSAKGSFDRVWWRKTLEQIVPRIGGSTTALARPRSSLVLAEHLTSLI